MFLVSLFRGKKDSSWPKNKKWIKNTSLWHSCHKQCVAAYIWQKLPKSSQSSTTSAVTMQAPYFILVCWPELNILRTYMAKIHWPPRRFIIAPAGVTPGVSSVRTDILFGLLSIDNWHRLGKKLQNGVELLNRIRNLRRNRTGTTRCRPKKYWTHGSFQVSITSLVDVLEHL
jgi:hypothetical protein